MKKWKFFVLMVLSLMLLTTGAGAAAIYEHYEGLAPHEGKIYALITKETHTEVYDFEYYPSEIAELDKDLKELRRLKLEDGTDSAKNSGILALHSDKLYIGSIGGALGASAWGDVWELDIGTWKARRIISASTTGAPSFVGISGLAIANDGTAFILTGGYDALWNYTATLYVTTVSDMSTGKTGVGAVIPGIGYSWGIAWSEYDQTLWMMAGSELQARSKTGELITTFTPSQLGDSIYSISPLDGRTGLIYTTSNYVTGSIGRITKTGSRYTVQKDLAAGFGGDSKVFAFNNHNGNPRVFLREYNYGTNDTVFIYNHGDYSKPIENASNWASNINAVAALENFLYLGTYESYESGNPDQLSGKLVRIDMLTWDEPKEELPGDDKPPVKKSSGGGGCSSGFGAFALLLVPIALRNRKR